MSYSKSRGPLSALLRLTLSLLAMAALSWLVLPSKVWNQLEPTASAASFVVTTATDNGDNANPTPGSLRDAILKANANGSAVTDTITFNIPGTNVHVIKANKELPTITTPVTINGYSQPGASVNTLSTGNNAVLKIELDGSLVASGAFDNGLWLATNGCTVRGLIIHGFNNGIRVTEDSNLVRGNFIGTDAAGTAALPNTSANVSVEGALNEIGGSAPADRNILSGSDTGISLHSNSQGNKVYGNYIGTDKTGTQKLGNDTGILLRGTSNVIGSAAAGMRNVISGNSIGLYVQDDTHKIQGNFIGLGADGTKLGNTSTGVNLYDSKGVIIGGTSEGNVISGNATGIAINAGTNVGQYTIIKGNFIGTNVSGSPDLGNSGTGIFLSTNARYNTIGGITNGDSNFIAYNGKAGITAINGSKYNNIQANKIVDNGELGIDLSAQGFANNVTLNDTNDVDDGGNGLQNFPVVTAAQYSGGLTSIVGNLNSTANTQFRLDFFANTTCDPLGHGEGDVYLGGMNVTTVGNNVQFNKTFPAFLAGQYITLTATDNEGNTSEFSKCMYVVSPAAGTLQFSQASYSVSEGAGKATITVTRTGGTSGGVTVKYATSNGSANLSEDYGKVSDTLTFLNGETSKTFDVPITDDTYYEGDEALNLTLSNATGGAVITGPASVPLNIIENDPKPTVSITDVTITEGNSGTKDAVFKVTVSGQTIFSINVPYATADVTAQGGSDFEPQSDTLTFFPGTTEQNITIKIKGDTDPESNEVFALTLGSPTNATLAKTYGTGTITNDDAAAPTIEFSQAAYSISEGTINTPQGFTSLTVNVKRSGDTSAAATVQYSTSDQSAGNECDLVTGFASQRCDYTTVAGTLRFAAGEATKQIQVPIINDGYVDGSEVFKISLQNPVGASLGAVKEVTVTITDSGTPATFSANNPYLSNAFFVRQNYLDFLGREPDAAGWNPPTGWPVVLGNCGPQEGFLGAPLNCDRAHVSHGFFASPEFTDKGFRIYRMYEVGLGRLPLYAEFIPDMATLSGYGIPASVEQQNLQDYLESFTQRPEFTNRFQGALAANEAEALILKLEQAAGVTLPATAVTNAGQPTQYGRNELIQKRASGQLTVGQTLLAFVEQQAVYDRFFPRGFVTMQYFAYLRRDPSLNDPNMTGWSDWVDVFTNGKPSAGIQPKDYHHLIFGFIYSIEYRKRFGQP